MPIDLGINSSSNASTNALMEQSNKNAGEITQVAMALAEAEKNDAIAQMKLQYVRDKNNKAIANGMDAVQDGMNHGKQAMEKLGEAAKAG